VPDSLRDGQELRDGGAGGGTVRSVQVLQYTGTLKVYTTAVWMCTVDGKLEISEFSRYVCSSVRT
jgi:hypothetical protein